MKRVPGLNNHQVFEEVPDQEVHLLSQKIHSQSVPIFGRSANDSGFVFHPRGAAKGFVVFSGGFRLLPKESPDAEGTFCFDFENKKYLFKAKLIKKSENQGELNLLTPLYRLQRRAAYRLPIPSDFYAVVRLTHVNSQKAGVFAKMADISERGLGLVVQANGLPINVGDRLNVVLNIRQRPPESLELMVAHCQTVEGSGGFGSAKHNQIMLGTHFNLESSQDTLKRVNHILMEIYRDLFGTYFSA
ncbi:MAG: hypothetical protein RJB66_1917 [Pseudomonadota bacterium]|jgi:hypothetical protein